MGDVEAKMDFVFTKTNFTDEISVVFGSVSSNVLGVKGDISEKENQILDISLTDIGEWDPDANLTENKYC